MKTTGIYCPTSSKFDIDHEINMLCEQMRIACKECDNNYTAKDAFNIKRAMAQTIIENL